MAEGGGLLNRYTLQRRIEGSNPSGSASSQPLLRRMIVIAKSQRRRVLHANSFVEGAVSRSRSHDSLVCID